MTWHSSVSHFLLQAHQFSKEKCIQWSSVLGSFETVSKQLKLFYHHYFVFNHVDHYLWESISTLPV